MTFNHDGTGGFTGETVTDEIDEVIVFHGSSLPTAGNSDIPTGGLFMLDGVGVYENTGTLGSPTWTRRVGTPAGVINMFAGLNANIPSGWLRCDGSAVSRTTYSDLFSAIGTEWGNGDGSTTFNLPDFETSNKFPRAAHQDAEVAQTGGESTHTLTTAEMPSHSHGVTDPGHIHGNDIADGSAGSNKIRGTSSSVNTGDIDTKSATTGISINNAGSGNSHENKPPYASVYFIIKT